MHGCSSARFVIKVTMDLVSRPKCISLMKPCSLISRCVFCCCWSHTLSLTLPQRRGNTELSVCVYAEATSRLQHHSLPLHARRGGPVQNTSLAGSSSMTTRSCCQARILDRVCQKSTKWSQNTRCMSTCCCGYTDSNIHMHVQLTAIAS